MSAGQKYKVKKVHIAALLGLVFAGCLAVLSFIHYSDGDDAFFLEYCGSMGFLEYLKWRYETWTGRMISEGFMHIFFNSDIWWWRIVNAGMLTALPLSLALLKNKVLNKNQLLEQENKNGHLLLSVFLALLFYLLIDIKTFGYSCIWITGSMNYLWPDVCGLLALYAVAGEAAADPKLGRKQAWIYAISIPCAVIAAMSSEQMGAVILAFEWLYIGGVIWQKRMPGKGILAQTVVTILAFAASSLAPGNDLRVAASVELYIPQFESLTLGERLFMTLQWLISSFANENAVLLTAIWAAGIFVLTARMKSAKYSGKAKWKTVGLLSGCGVFAVAAIAGKLGFAAVCDIGMDLAQMIGRVEAVPTVHDMTGAQWGAFFWWSAAIMFTLFLLYEITEGMPVAVLNYLGAIACEAIMIFSPSIYTSGERVFFLTDIMLFFLVLWLFERVREVKRSTCYIGILLLLAFGNLALQASELMGMLAG